MRLPNGIVVASRSYAAIEESAAAYRVALLPMLAWTQKVDALALFDSLDGSTIVLPNGKLATITTEVSDRLPPSTEAVTQYDSRRGRVRIILSERTYLALEAGVPRAAFTLAHELGHAVLHLAELMRLQAVPHLAQALARSHARHAPYEDSEWQANAFASAFLMPAVGIAELEWTLGRVSADRLQDTFGVSAQAAGHRLSNYNARRAALVRASLVGGRGDGAN